MKAFWVLASLLAVLLLGFVTLFYARVENGHRSTPAEVDAVAAVRVSRGFAEMPPSSEVIRVNDSSAAQDDFEAWQALDALAPRAADEPSWVRSVGGSQSWSEAVRGIALRGRYPGPKERLVGYSRELEPTKELAQEAARQSAIQQLATLSLRQILESGPQKPWSVSDVNSLRNVLCNLFRSEMKDLVREWYEQPVTLRGGHVYRAALLFKAPKERISANAAQARQLVNNERFDSRRRLLTKAGLGFGAAIVILFVYSILNAATKGHFAWTLRILSAGALAAVYLLFIA